MKKRTLCLLLAGVMALSLLSGCGGKTAGGQPNTPDNSPVETGGNIPDNVPNNEAPMVPPEDWEDPTQPEDDLPFPRDPRWDELQPGETAVQFADVFIKSGMTLGEALEAIDNSELFLTTSHTFKLDEPNTIVRTDYPAASHNCIVRCDGEDVFEFYLAYQLPGEKDYTFVLRDCPIWLVRSLQGIQDDRIRTKYGTVSEIKAMREEDVQTLVDTEFAGMGAEVETSKTTSSGVNLVCYTIYYTRDFSWDGYALYKDKSYSDPANWEKGIPYRASFQFVYETGELYSCSIDEVNVHADPYFKTYRGFKWGPENPAE